MIDQVIDIVNNISLPLATPEAVASHPWSLISIGRFDIRFRPSFLRVHPPKIVQWKKEIQEQAKHGLKGDPEMLDSDQGSQFTSEAFSTVLKREGIVVSMDGRGRANENILVELLRRSVKLGTCI
jgi:transposase InsO family protein